jgi:hypothetical protein
MKKIVLVGHCGADGPWLTKYIKDNCNQEAVSVDSTDDLDQFSPEETLVLLNRVNNTTGSDDTIKIKELVDKGYSVVLVSNFKESQEQAEQQGALRGFGKDDLRTNMPAEKISAYCDLNA